MVKYAPSMPNSDKSRTQMVRSAVAGGLRVQSV